MSILLALLFVALVFADNTFIVNTQLKTASNPYFGIGNTNGYNINGVEAATISLIAGQTYVFTCNNPAFHPFYITTDPMGHDSVNQYSNGITPQSGGVYGGSTLTFVTSSSTPPLLYYGCMNHAWMGYNITVVDSTASAAATAAAATSAAATSAAATSAAATSAAATSAAATSAAATSAAATSAAATSAAATSAAATSAAATSAAATSAAATSAAATSAAATTATSGSSITAPGSPSVPTATSIKSTSIAITWSAPSSDGGSPITGYVVHHMSVTGDDVISATTNSTTLGGLNPGQSYTFEVKAQNAVGTSAYGPAATFTTGTVTVPGAPSAPSASSITKTSMQLSWSAPSSDGGSAITGYEVHHSSSTGSNVFYTTGTSSAFGGLTAGKSYTIEVAARNSQGYGSYGVAETFTTAS